MSLYLAVLFFLAYCIFLGWVIKRDFKLIREEWRKLRSR